MASDQDLKINTLEIMMEQNKTEHAEIKDMVKAGFKDLTEKIDAIADGKANKWVETALSWFLYAVAGGLIIWIITNFPKIIKLL